MGDRDRYASARAREVRPSRSSRRRERRDAGAGLNPVARSFGWPFRGGRRSTWLFGILALVVLPLGLIPLLGYAIAATRAASGEGPPPWRLNARLLADGVTVGGAIALIAAPFVLAAIPLSGALAIPALWRTGGPLLGVEAATSAALIVALPWGLVMLLLMPHSVARFAATGSARDMFDFGASLRGVRRDFATWNVVIAAIVTAWAIGLACSALFCIGLVPGTLYAILVSANATASLSPTGAHQPPG